MVQTWLSCLLSSCDGCLVSLSSFAVAGFLRSEWPSGISGAIISRTSCFYFQDSISIITIQHDQDYLPLLWLQESVLFLYDPRSILNKAHKDDSKKQHVICFWLAIIDFDTEYSRITRNKSQFTNLGIKRRKQFLTKPCYTKKSKERDDRCYQIYFTCSKHPTTFRAVL